MPCEKGVGVPEVRGNRVQVKEGAAGPEWRLNPADRELRPLSRTFKVKPKTLSITPKPIKPPPHPTPWTTPSISSLDDTHPLLFDSSNMKADA